MFGNESSNILKGGVVRFKVQSFLVSLSWSFSSAALFTSLEEAGAPLIFLDMNSQARVDCDPFNEATMSDLVLTESEKRWTPALMNAGFTIIPNVLLEHQKSLGFDALDLNILAQLLSYWWSKDNLPHPSKKTIAFRIGVDVSTVRRRIAKMEKKGLIKRKARFNNERRRKANGYDLSDLIRLATPYALQMIHRRNANVTRLLRLSDIDAGLMNEESDVESLSRIADDK